MRPLTILCLSLIALPLFGNILIEPFIPQAHSLLESKEFMAMFFILAMAAAGAPGEKTLQNPFLLALLVFLPISMANAPAIKMMYYTENMGGLWMWRSLAWCAGYFLLYRSISGIPFYMQRHKRILIDCLTWPAIVSAGYAFLQALNLDQFQITRPIEEIGAQAVPGITAVIGHPTYLAIYLTICLPFCVLYRKWYWTAAVFAAILLCQSQTAIAGAIVMAGFLACLRAKRVKWLWVYICVGLVSFFLLWAFWDDLRPKLTAAANGRFPVWQQAFEDWKSPAIKMETTPEMSPAQKKEIERLNKQTYVLTGRGPGSFVFLFTPKWQTKFDSAHNVYLQALYEIGIIGLALLLGAVAWVFVKTFPAAREDPFTAAAYASLFFICLAGVLHPIAQTEPLRYVACVIFALLSARCQRIHETVHDKGGLDLFNRHCHTLPLKNLVSPLDG